MKGSKTVNKKGKLLLSGNEAIALGAYEAGVRVASAYPGTPSTEIMENLSGYEGVYAEWAPNEKVAFEVALGASFAGTRALASMKHVGLNIAADPLFTSAYTGVRGGFVVVTADDPGMHSSQNEQDNRNYAFSAKVPMLEPSDAAEAKEFTKLGFKLSERFDIPVLLRTTTRVSHVKGVVKAGKKEELKAPEEMVKEPQKLVMLPAHARMRRVDLEKRLQKIKAFAEKFKHNRIEKGSKSKGFITSGISYLYVKEAFPDASILKLGMVWPLPEKMIMEFSKSVRELYVVEELDPFLETHIKAMGIKLKGKEVIPSRGELDQSIIRSAITGRPSSATFKPHKLPIRPPNLCPGCPHRGVFYALSKLNVFVSGDIGCYTLGALKPLSSMDTCICMGASISGAHGMDKALGKEGVGKVVSVIGDSTFIHSGITGLIDIVYNKGASTVIILDNRITAMTGHQPTPSSGTTIKGEPAFELDFHTLAKAVGVEHVYHLPAHDIKEAREIIKREIERPEPSVLVTNAPCALLPAVRKEKKPRYSVVVEKCTGCRACIGLGCPAIEWVPVTAKEARELGYREKQRGHSNIIDVLCAGCSQCEQLCKFGAIVSEENGG